MSGGYPKGDLRYRNNIPYIKLLVYLGIIAYLAILPRGLYYYNLLLLEGPFYLYATAFYKVSVEFLLGRGEIFKVG